VRDSNHLFPALLAEPEADRRPAHQSSLVAIAGIVVLLLVSMCAPAGSGANAPHSSGGMALDISHPVGGIAPAGPGPNCTALSTGWSLIDGVHPAPDVAASLEGPCLTGHDVPGLYFLSNASGSGEHFQVALTLPSSASSPASSYAAFWVGLWVAGIPCSYGGASYLTVELIPPYSSAAGAPLSANWSVSAPVWDLVPPGTCDSQCTNDTAFVTIQSRSFCEDDAVLSGIGALNGTVSGRFAPGDQLSLAFAGTAGGSEPLAVYLNDSTTAGRSLSWNYTAGTSFPPGGPPPTGTVSGRPLTPLYATASAGNGGWTGGLDVGFGWQNCPLPSPNAGVSACNSYDGPVAQVAGTPQVQLVTSWNTTSHSYANTFPSMVTVSSSGACSGATGTSPCESFSTDGGTGTYPTYTLDAGNGHAWLEYGASPPNVVSNFGGVPAEFPSQGNLSSPFGTTAITNVRTLVGSSSVMVTARVSDMYGVTQVRMSDWWCPSLGTRVPSTIPATLTAGGFNTPLDGNWSATFPTNGRTGLLYFGIAARSFTGVSGPPVNQNVAVSGVGTSCGASAPPNPTLAAANISALGGGYTVTWNESVGAGVIAYQLSATNGTAMLNFPEGNVTSASIFGLAGHAVYTVRVAAINRAGLQSVSGPATGPTTYAPLATRALNITASSSSWVNLTSAKVVANVTGGLPPFTFAFHFGDGTSASIFTVSGDASANHPFALNYSGVAAIVVVITDSVGDSITAPTGYVSVFATPLGTPTTLASGDGFVQLRWTPPTAPPGLPIVGYTVYWTTDPAWAPYLTLAWPSNASVPAVHTFDTAVALTVSIPVAVGTEIFAQVVGWDKYGEGLLPPELALGEEPVLSAVDAGFASSGITLSPAGGTAPVLTSFSTEFTTGPGTHVVNATYRFTGGSAVVAPISGTNGRYWANASFTFSTPGARTVYLYALDSVNELLLLTSGLYVAPSAGPLVSVSLTPTPVFAGSPVMASAAPSGGSGNYTYSWEFGTGSNATGASVDYTYPSAGTFLLSVVVTDAVYGGVTTSHVPVSVFGPPTVAIGVVPAKAPGSYALAAFATGEFYGPLAYTWVFGDGAQATGANVSHTWANPGKYTIDVRVTDAAGHTTVASTNLTVVYPAGTTSPSSETFPPIAVGLLIAVILLAIVVIVLLVRQRRGRDGAPTAGEAGTYDAQAPAPSYAEEEAPRMR